MLQSVDSSPMTAGRLGNRCWSTPDESQFHFQTGTVDLSHRIEGSFHQDLIGIWIAIRVVFPGQKYSCQTMLRRCPEGKQRRAPDRPQDPELFTPGGQKTESPGRCTPFPGIVTYLY